MKFIDTAQIRVKAGDGGVGCVSFRREKFVPRGGPDGGDGGRGGDVVLLPNRHMNTLLDFHYKRVYRADRGEHGLGSRKTGKSAESIVLQVPVGTIVKDALTGGVLADLVDEGREHVIAMGGRGGRGNAAFATSTNQAPRNYEQGTPGEERDLLLELKLLADVGLVGFPNSGKSTLISVISAAKPKIADYPFTTLVPNLGIVRVEEGKSFVVADIPGLIEGAHQGKGLGTQFLRHIERTRVLVFLIDVTSETPLEDYLILLNELKSFNAELIRKPRIVALTKADVLTAEQLAEIAGVSFRRFKTKPKPGVPTFIISAIKREGIAPLVGEMWKALQPRRKTRAPKVVTRKRA